MDGLAELGKRIEILIYRQAARVVKKEVMCSYFPRLPSFLLMFCYIMYGAAGGEMFSASNLQWCVIHVHIQTQRGWILCDRLMFMAAVV